MPKRIQLRTNNLSIKELLNNVDVPQQDLKILLDALLYAGQNTSDQEKKIKYRYIYKKYIKRL